MQEGRSMYGSLPPINPSHLHILGLILWLDRRQLLAAFPCLRALQPRTTSLPRKVDSSKE